MAEKWKTKASSWPLGPVIVEITENDYLMKKKRLILPNIVDAVDLWTVRSCPNGSLAIADLGLGHYAAIKKSKVIRSE